MLKKLLSFVGCNKSALLGILAGSLLAYFYWLYFGIYCETYPLSSECWKNCIYGSLLGGLIGCLFSGEA